MNSYSVSRHEQNELTATVSEKGQVTIPKRLRESLGLGRGTVLRFTERTGELVATKLIEENPFEGARGTLKLPEGMSVDDLMDELRGPVDLP